MTIRNYTQDEIDRFTEETEPGWCKKCRCYDEALDNGICFSCQEKDNE